MILDPDGVGGVVEILNGPCRALTQCSHSMRLIRLDAQDFEDLNNTSLGVGHSIGKQIATCMHHIYSINLTGQ